MGILIPRKFFLSSLLIITVLIPINYISNSSTTMVFYPAMLLSLSILIRQMLMGGNFFQFSKIKNLQTYLLGFYLLFSPLLTNVIVRSLCFNLSILITILLLTSNKFDTNSGNFRKTWGLLLVFEGICSALQLLTGQIPFYTFANSKSLFPVAQNWSVERFTGTFGHPLPASTFFCVSSVVFANLYLQKHRKSDLFLTIIAIILTLGTFSRGSMISMIVGFAILALNGMSLHKNFFRTLAGLFFLLVMIIMVNFFYGIRNSSYEGTGSLLARKNAFDILLSSLPNYFFGVGGGNAQFFFQEHFSTRLILENSTLQCLVGLGIIGTVLLFLSFKATITGLSLTRGVVPAFVTFLISVNTYNFFEGARWLHVVPALIVLIIREEQNS